VFAVSLSHNLLAHGGVDSHLVASTLQAVGDLSSAFSPLHPLPDTDIAGYLQHAHEQTIISAIEEGRRATVSDFYRDFDKRMKDDWERQKEQVFEELGRHSGMSGAVLAGVGPAKRSRRSAVFEEVEMAAPREGTSALQLHSRMMRYDRVIRKLNDHRKQRVPFGVVSAMGDASASSTKDAVRFSCLP
jgi:nuclear pore complex protein Nup93